MSDKITKVTKQYPTTTVTLYAVNVYQLEQDLVDLEQMRKIAATYESDVTLESYARSISIIKRIIAKYT